MYSFMNDEDKDLFLKSINEYIEKVKEYKI